MTKINTKKKFRLGEPITKKTDFRRQKRINLEMNNKKCANKIFITIKKIFSRQKFDETCKILRFLKQNVWRNLSRKQTHGTCARALIQPEVQPSVVNVLNSNRF